MYTTFPAGAEEAGERLASFEAITLYVRKEYKGGIREYAAFLVADKVVVTSKHSDGEQCKVTPDIKPNIYTIFIIAVLALSQLLPHTPTYTYSQLQLLQT